MSLSRVILTTGGTGGHIFPALAVAEEIRRREPAARVHFIGGAYGPERELATKAGLEFTALPVRGVLGRGLRAVGALAGLARGIMLARGIVAREKPQVVAGFGGYAGFCPVVAARLSRVPTAIHEQNSVPGAANRLLGRFADRVLVTYPDERGAFDPAKTVRTGNPVRAAIAAVREAGERGSDGAHLLVLGGSQGARALNSAVAAAWPQLARRGVKLWHQTGAADHERMASIYVAQGGTPPRVAPFVEDMAEAYAWADLVAGRAGATTLAELTVAGRPSILVPFPYATHDHQTVNARYLASRGAAELLPENEATPERLAEIVLGLFGDPEKLLLMARAARAEGRPDAAAAVVDELERLAVSA